MSQWRDFVADNGIRSGSSQGYTPLVNLSIQVGDTVVDAKDVFQLCGEGTGDCATQKAICQSGSGAGLGDYVCFFLGVETYDWGRRPLGFQSRSMSSSDLKSTVGGMLAALVGVAVGEEAISDGR